MFPNESLLPSTSPTFSASSITSATAAATKVMSAAKQLNSAKQEIVGRASVWAAMLNAGMESGRAVTGKVQMTMHLVEYLVMPFTTINADLDIKPPNWFINLTWLSAL